MVSVCNYDPAEGNNNKKGLGQKNQTISLDRASSVLQKANSNQPSIFISKQCEIKVSVITYLDIVCIFTKIPQKSAEKSRALWNSNPKQVSIRYAAGNRVSTDDGKSSDANHMLKKKVFKKSSPGRGPEAGEYFR
ncbi:hypothetical protein NPIL_188901 [Nephila pilipes]|uniref:Uncharacterized protein n=1 Tax=Nephila pilipes TaxID=299642 RepID=A0A8X6MM85_NEPPI|nr:hypothetical protein NPIL_188901 [Nephila pilipes]